MSKNQETNTDENSCEHCGRVFVRSSTLLKHICEQKRRWLERDKPANRIGYASWREFYKQYHPSKKKLEYSDFISSAYYTAFIKFGIYCTDVKVINSLEYSSFLLRNKISVDNWTSDKHYTKYLVEYMRAENAMDAIKRSIDSMLTLTETENIQLSDFFKYVSQNKICQMITNGHISPWVLYQSTTGLEFLSKLNSDQTSLIFEYIDPEKWNIKFKREQEKVNEVKSVVEKIPL
jgi:hypothetical protein